MERPEDVSMAFFNYAHSYASSAHTLGVADVIATHADAPISFLYFHAIELYLKAFLIARGLTERDLRKREYGHNLCCLANEAEIRGLALTETDKRVILHLSETDNIITSRYIRLGLHQQLSTEALSYSPFLGQISG